MTHTKERDADEKEDYDDDDDGDDDDGDDEDDDAMLSAHSSWRQFWPAGHNIPCLLPNSDINNDDDHTDYDDDHIDYDDDDHIDYDDDGSSDNGDANGDEGDKNSGDDIAWDEENNARRDGWRSTDVSGQTGRGRTAQYLRRWEPCHMQRRGGAPGVPSLALSRDIGEKENKWWREVLHGEYRPILIFCDYECVSVFLCVCMCMYVC